TPPSLSSNTPTHQLPHRLFTYAARFFPFITRCLPLPVSQYTEPLVACPSVDRDARGLSVSTYERPWTVRQYTEPPVDCPSVHTNVRGLSVSTQRRPGTVRQHTEADEDCSPLHRNGPCADLQYMPTTEARRAVQDDARQ